MCIRDSRSSALWARRRDRPLLRHPPLRGHPMVLVWLRSRRPDSYAPVRNTLVGASVAALFAYWLIPLAPPRLSVPAVIDTMKLNEILSAGSPSGLAALSNQYAAMPSLHVAWAVWVALAVAVAFPTCLLYTSPSPRDRT